jgi:hypothetical protein
VLAYVCEPPAYKPSTLLIACGDGNVRVTHLRWASWSGTRATGSGTWEQNNCEPNCAQGRFIDYAVRLTLTQPIRGQGASIFGTVAAAFPAAVPPYPAYGSHHALIMHNGRQVG